MANIGTRCDFEADILSIEPQRVRSFVGIDFEAARMRLEQTTGAAQQRIVLMKRLEVISSADALVAEVLMTLAETALRLWPVWYSDLNFGELRSSILDRTAACLKVEEFSREIPRLSATWAKRAVVKAISGRLPLLRHFPRETQLKQLSLAISRRGLILVVALERLDHDAGALRSLVLALEWLARRAEMAIAVLMAHELATHPALERIMFNAITVEAPRAVSPMPRLPEALDGKRTGTVLHAREEPADVWLWPVVGRPHPNSPGELKLAKALLADADLGQLFSYNQRVETIYKSYPTVDLLWEEGRVVVEVDGYSHCQPDEYAGDRHRDFQLLVSGYFVLRLTHGEVMFDTAHAVEKIRKVVDYRKSMKRKTEQQP